MLVVEAAPQTLEQFARDGNLELVGGEKAPKKVPEKVLAMAVQGEQAIADNKPAARGKDAPVAERPSPAERELSIVEAVISLGSDLIGRSATMLHLRERYGVNVLAISRQGRLRSTRLRGTRFKAGDAIVLQGHTEQLPDILAALGCLPLAERQLNLGRPRKLLVPLAILLLAIVASSLELVPVAIAFVAAAVALVFFGLLSLKEAYGSVEWPILVLLGCLIPIGEAVEHTGTAKLIANSMAGAAAGMPGYAVIAFVLAVTMLLTPICITRPRCW